MAPRRPPGVGVVPGEPAHRVHRHEGLARRDPDRPRVGLVPCAHSDFSIGAQPYDYFSVAATLSQPLFTWGKIRAAIDAAALQVDSAGTDLVAQQRDIEREVHRAYFSAAPRAGNRRRCFAICPRPRQVSWPTGRPPWTRAPSRGKESWKRSPARPRSIRGSCRPSRARRTALESLGMLTGLDPSAIELATGFRDVHAARSMRRRFAPGPRRLPRTWPHPASARARRRRSSTSRKAAQLLHPTFPRREPRRHRRAELLRAERKRRRTPTRLHLLEPGTSSSPWA